MLGYTADAIHEMSAVGLDNLIHPDGLNLVSDHYQRFATLRSNDVMMTNYRMKRADGAWCWLHSQETPLLAAIDGFPLQILGSVRLLPHLLACSPED
ncbi:PAS domain-containing protein [Oscillatoria sp. FACHB-1407]|nr:PAS domain-containing protein [Oscillatoria sp. FACHB-1407]MBD2464764.1 PAS domain-containing protein [Oscillatoria sp. FACHB-1407]